MYHYRPIQINRHFRIFLATLFALGLHAILLQTDFQLQPANLQLETQSGRAVTITLVASEITHQDTEEVLAKSVPDRVEQSRGVSDVAAAKETSVKEDLFRQERLPDASIEKQVLPAVDTFQESEPPSFDNADRQKHNQPDPAVISEPEYLKPASLKTVGEITQQHAVLANTRQPAGDALDADAKSTLVYRNAEPLYNKNPAPYYPGLARKRGYEGVVMLDVLVSAQGKVEEIKMGQSSGYPILDRSAEKAVTKWNFSPGVRRGKPVDTWVVVPVRFELN